MDNLIIERDVVLIGKTEEGNSTFDFPVTRLGNVEDGAEIKEKPVSGDYIPIMDMEDDGQMKKTPYVHINEQSFEFEESKELATFSSGEKLGTLFGKLAKAVKELITHLADNVKHITASERASWNGKANGTHGHSAVEISGLPASLPANGGNADTVDNKHASDFAASIHSHSAASQSADGFMSLADKKKLDGITEGANKYTHPSTSGNKHIPSGGASGQILRWLSDGTATWGADNNTTHAAATQNADGLMSAADKTKLDGIATGANKYTHPAYTARTGVPKTNQTPSFGDTFSISQPVSDVSGHVTSMNERTVKIPNNVASQSEAGLMSAGDKIRLDSIPDNVFNLRFTKGTIQVDYGFFGTKTITIPHNVDMFIAYRASSAEGFTLAPADGESHSSGSPITVENNGSTATLTLDYKASASSTYTFTYYAFKFI